MKKNSLTMAVVAGFAGAAGLANVATAVNVNPDGLGQVLIYPYYTVNGGNATLISVVNTVDEVKAVKVRFLEAKNSREVLDFNLYLSPFDVWTGAVTTSGDSPTAANLSTNDTSCTVPDIPAAGVDFRNFFYGTAPNNDDAENDLGRTREGHIEMIEMGVVDEDVTGAATSYEASAIHGVDPDGVGAGAPATPANCNRLIASWSGNLPANNWFDDGSIDVRGPTGGLFGGATIVNVAAGTSLSYNPEAIDGFYLLNNANLHTRPGSTLPSLAQAQTSLGEADSIIFDNGALITLDFLSGRADAVSSVFMHDNIYNEYNTVGDFSKSEWVITFPTKRLHIEQGTAEARLPFANDSNGSGDGLQFDVSGYCEPIQVTYFDREEQETGVAPGDVDFSPEPPVVTPPGTNLCWEANVLTWNQTAEVTAGASAVLGSRFANNINLLDVNGEVFTEGWIGLGIGNENNYLLDLGASGLGDDTGVEPRNQLFGLPVIGFWAANFINGNAGGAGVLANYSVISKHRASRDSRSVTVNAGVITPTGNPAS